MISFPLSDTRLNVSQEGRRRGRAGQAPRCSKGRKPFPGSLSHSSILLLNYKFSESLSLKGPGSRDELELRWHAWVDLGLRKGRGRFMGAHRRACLRPLLHRQYPGYWSWWPATVLRIWWSHCTVYKTVLFSVYNKINIRSKSKFAYCPYHFLLC